MLPFKIIEENGTPKVEAIIKGEVKKMAPEEISAMVLVKMKEIAEAYLGKKVRVLNQKKFSNCDKILMFFNLLFLNKNRLRAQS